MTDDEDFLKTAAVGVSHYGIVKYKRRNRGIGRVIQRLELLWEIYDSDELINRIEYL